MDEHEGKGGSYVMIDGKRHLVERTEDHPQGNRPRGGNDSPLDGDEIEQQPVEE